MKILAAGLIAQEAQEILRKKHELKVEELDHESLLRYIHEYDALIVRSGTHVTEEVIKNGKKLKVIAVAGIGVDKIDIRHATQREIVVLNAPFGSTYSVAELTIGFIVLIARQITKADLSVKEGRWIKKYMKGVELYDKILGLIGSGRIGREVARRAQGFGMKVQTYDPYVSAESLVRLGIKPVELDELLTESDFISIHSVLTPETRGMMNIERFKKMKKSAFLINTSRGLIINEKDLAEALNQGLIAGAALDVYQVEPPKDSPLLKLENILLTPHLGASTREGQKRAGIIIAEDMLRVLDGEKADNIVNSELYY